MSRLRPITESDLDDQQRQLWDGITGSRGGGGLDLFTPDGGLAGPFNAWLHAPEIGRRLSSLGGHLRFGTAFDRRLTEVVICTVGAFWQAEFEFFAHAPMALDHGVEPAVIEALREGRTPEFSRNDERIVHAVTTQLLERHRVDDATYAEAAELLGETQLVELVSVAGYYCLISMMLNLFDVPLPEGATTIWS